VNAYLIVPGSSFVSREAYLVFRLSKAGLKKLPPHISAASTNRRHWALTRHCRLTDSPARTNMVLFIHRTVRLTILRVVDLHASRRFQHAGFREVKARIPHRVVCSNLGAEGRGRENPARTPHHRDAAQDCIHFSNGCYPDRYRGKGQSPSERRYRGQGSTSVPFAIPLHRSDPFENTDGRLPGDHWTAPY
jgi:hypothetical protein